MLAFDTNLVVYAANIDAREHSSAAAFVNSLAPRRDVVVCELMLVEVYLKLRNPKILAHPMDAPSAVAFCAALRANANWRSVENATVMPAVWQLASVQNFAFRRIIDARLALTLRHYGVTEFATVNVKDFEGFGFERVWNPLEEARF
jgi:toxin-antitoxin system PIN domain toxin